MKACNFGLCAAMRASSASTTSTGDSRCAASSAASRWAGRKLGSVLDEGMTVRPADRVRLFRVEAAIDAGRTDVVPHEGADAVAPRIAVAGPRPFRGLRHAGMLELVERQVFRLAVDRDVAARAEAAGTLEIRRDVGGVVPVVELFLDHRRDIDSSHLQKRRGLAGLLNRIAMDRKDLP